MHDDRLSDIQDVMVDIKVRLFAHLEQEEQQNAEIHDLLKKHNRAIYGNGEPGLRTQVDRLERSEDNRKWHYGIIYTALVAAAVKLIIDWVRNP